MNRIFLIGPMGSGKTTVGRFLAGRLGLEFLDLDCEIERRCGVEVRTIFDIEGEAGFRARERAMLDEITQRDGILMATGGGSVLDPDNRRMLRERGLVVWLKTRVEQQLQRLDRDQRRPLLQAPDREQRLERMASERDPILSRMRPPDNPLGQRQSDADGRSCRASYSRVSAKRERHMKVIQVRHGGGEYPVYVGQGLLGMSSVLDRHLEGRILVVTDENVGRLYLDRLRPVLGRIDHKRRLILPAGERKQDGREPGPPYR